MYVPVVLILPVYATCPAHPSWLLRHSAVRIFAVSPCPELDTWLLAAACSAYPKKLTLISRKVSHWHVDLQDSRSPLRLPWGTQFRGSACRLYQWWIATKTVIKRSPNGKRNRDILTKQFVTQTQKKAVVCLLNTTLWRRIAGIEVKLHAF
jgi:hypothetical protein